MPGLTNEQRVKPTDASIAATAVSSNSFLLSALDLLREILLELKIIKVHISTVTDEAVSPADIEEL